MVFLLSLSSLKEGDVTWYPTETIEIKSILSSRWNEQWKPVKKVTVKKECRSQRGYQRMLVLSNLRSPDNQGEEGRSQMIGWGLKRKSRRWSLWLLVIPKLRGCRYETIEEMKEAVTKVIDTLTQGTSWGLPWGLPKLLERYNKSIEAGGDYFEGTRVSCVYYQ